MRNLLVIVALLSMFSIAPVAHAQSGVRIESKADADKLLDQIQAYTFTIDLSRPTSSDTVRQAHREYEPYGNLVRDAERYEQPGDSRVAHAYANLARSYFNAFDIGDAERYARETERVAKLDPAHNDEALRVLPSLHCFVAMGLEFSKAIDSGKALPPEDLEAAKDICLAARSSAIESDKAVIDRLLYSLSSDRSQRLEGDGSDETPGDVYIRAYDADSVAKQIEILSANPFDQNQLDYRAASVGALAPKAVARFKQEWILWSFANLARLAQLQASSGRGEAGATLQSIHPMLDGIDRQYDYRELSLSSASAYLTGLAYAADAAYRLRDETEGAIFIQHFAAADRANIKFIPAQYDGLVEPYSFVTGLVFNHPKADPYVEAEPFARKAALYSSLVMDRFVSDSGQDLGYYSDDQMRDFYRDAFDHLIEIAGHLNTDSELAFAAAQWERSTEAGSALRDTVLRLAANTPELGTLLSQRAQLRAAADGLSQRGQGKSITESADLTSERENARKQLETKDQEIARRFPQYASLVPSRPSKIAELQSVLGDEEAVVLYAPRQYETLVFVVRKTSVVLRPLQINSTQLLEAVNHLRQGLVLEDGVAPHAFDLDGAHQLYLKIFQPIQNDLSGAKRLFIVSDGALEKLPLSVLVAQVGSSYANSHWIGQDYGLVTLPEVASLVLLRTQTLNQNWSTPFVGFGDPVLGPARAAQAVPDQPLAVVEGGNTPNEAAIRSLASLPDTGLEIEAVANNLGAPAAATHLQGDDTEVSLKRLDRDGELRKARIVMISTHGLLGGVDPDGRPISPGLVFTPPASPSADDDGYLSADEAASLRLNADLVVLSACNTAAGTGAGRPLDGLARAFLSAGARSLLVSHWAVNAEATRQLMAAAIVPPSKEGRSEALRSAMDAMIKNPRYSHPAYWAPFVLVGEGR